MKTQIISRSKSVKQALALILSAAFLLGSERSSAMSCKLTLELLGSAHPAHVETMKAEGDFIHSIWQTGNSYRTRYKAMKGDVLLYSFRVSGENGELGENGQSEKGRGSLPTGKRCPRS